MENSFYTLKVIIGLKKVSIFISDLVKKSHYCPKYVNREDIKVHFKGKPPGYFDASKGRTEENDFI